MATKFLDLNGMIYVIAELDGRYVAPEDGKGLSANDFTDILKAKLESLNVPLDVLTSTDATSPLSANQGRALKVLIDTITNAGYQTESDVEEAIAAALADISGISFEIVESLPASGVAGVFYLVPNATEGSDVYDEYIWLTDKFEKIGTTAVDLSGYWSKDELVAMTNAEIDAILAT